MCQIQLKKRKVTGSIQYKTIKKITNNNFKILDVEFSKHVEDDSVVYIKRLKGLVKINVFRTNLSMEGQVIEFLKYKSQILRSKIPLTPIQVRHFE